MAKTKRLTRRQYAVIDDLFLEEPGEPKEPEKSKGPVLAAVLAKHRVHRRLYERWLADERFIEQIERRIAQAYHQSRVALAAHAPKAASQLIGLTGCQKDEVVRRACLDIISLQPSAGQKKSRPEQATANTSTEPKLSPEKASRLLAVLAEDAPGDQLNEPQSS